VTCREGTLAVVMNTAFSTRKGKIIRKILHVNPSSSEFFRSMLPFIGQVILVHILLFAIFFEYMFKDINNSTIIWLRFG
jgi:magnesium-transporting ATPase (P-type)